MPRERPECVAWVSAFGPLRPRPSGRSPLGGGRGKGPSGQPGALRWSGLRCAQTALRCSHPRPRRRTHCVRFAHSVQTAATSQMTIRASRGATGAALLGAPEARSSLPGRAFAGVLGLFVARNTSATARQAVPGGGDFCGGEEVSRDGVGPEDRLCLANGRASGPGAACKARASVGARSALRRLTRRSCLSGESAANAASSATRLKAEHRSGVGAQRRPPQHEPPAGTACRAAPEPRRSGLQRAAAMGRKLLARRSGKEPASFLCHRPSLAAAV